MIACSGNNWRGEYLLLFGNLKPSHIGLSSSLLLTGARIATLSQWADVDFRWQSMTIKDKVEGQRVIPLTPYVASLLVSLPRRNAFVFHPLLPHRDVCRNPVFGVTSPGSCRSERVTPHGRGAVWHPVQMGRGTRRGGCQHGHNASATAEKRTDEGHSTSLRMAGTPKLNPGFWNRPALNCRKKNRYRNLRVVET